MGPDDIYEEPRAAAEPRLVSKVHDQASEPQPSEAAFVGRTFLGRWNLDRGLGLAEELSCQGWQRRRRWRELPQREAQERHPCEHERSGGHLYRKAPGREAKLCYMGHATMETRHGLAVAGLVTKATGTAERRASKQCSRPKPRQKAGASLSARTKPMIPPITWLSCEAPTQNNGTAKTGKARSSA